MAFVEYRGKIEEYPFEEKDTAEDLLSRVFPKATPDFLAAMKIQKEDGTLLGRLHKEKMLDLLSIGCGDSKETPIKLFVPSTLTQ